MSIPGLPPGANLSQIPSGQPPPGVEPNFVDPVSLNPVILGVSIPLMCIGIFTASISIGRHRKNFRATDYLAFFAVIFAIAYTSIIIHIGPLQVHQWDLPLSLAIDPTYMKLLYAQDILTMPSFICAKGAILTLYLFIFKVNRDFRIAVVCGFVLNLLAYLPQIAIASIFCAPPAGQGWEIDIGEKCRLDDIWALVSSPLTIILDVYIFILPIPMVARLTMSKRRKIGVLAVFGTGALGIISSVVSLAYRVILKESTVDQSWTGAVTMICSVVELWVAVFIATIPASAASLKQWASDSTTAVSSMVSPVMNAWLSLSHSRTRGSRGQEGSANSMDDATHAPYSKVEEDSKEHIEMMRGIA